MSYGYTLKLVSLNRAANKNSLGVKLGKLCIQYDIPVAYVSSSLGVSRQTVYNWFTGESEPNEKTKESIEKLITKIKR